VPSRRGRWIRRALASIGVVLLLAIVALVVIVRGLDRPWVKRRVQALAHARTGLDIDYTETHVGLFSGLRIERLVVLTPPALRDRAPELLRADGLEVPWTGRSLLFGTPRFGALRVEALALTLVRDAAGRTSLTTIEPHGEAKAAEALVPPSRAAADALEGPPPVGRIDLERVTVTVLAQVASGPREELRVDGLALHARLEPAGRGFYVGAGLGTPDAPLMVTVTRTRDGAAAGEARAKLFGGVTASPTAAMVAVHLEVLSQTMVPETKVKEAAHIEARARFGDGRVQLTVAQTRLADGAATSDAEIELPDGAAPRIVHADGAIDLPRVLAVLPASLVPIEAERARLRYHVSGDSGTVEGELGRVRVALAKGALVVDGGKLVASAKPVKGATLVRATVPVASLALPGVAAEKLVATVDARIAADRAISGDASVRFGAVRASGPTKVTVSDGELGAHVEELRVDTAVPLATRGQVTVTARAANVDAVHAATHAIADGVATTVRAHLRGEPPYAVEVEAPIARLRVLSEGRALVDGASTVTLRASEVRPDLTRAQRTRGKLHADVTLGALALAVDADKAPDAVDYKLHADAASLALLRPLVPRDAAWHAPWDRMSLTLASDGRLEHLAAPSLREHTTLAVGHAAFDGPKGSVAADRVEAELTSQGTPQKHDVTLELRTRALAVGGAAQGDTAIHAQAAYDRRASTAHVKVATLGDKGPLVALDAALGFARARRAVTYELDGKVGRLASLAPLVQGGAAGFDYEHLGVAIKASGSLAGLVHDVDKNGAVHFVDDPLRTLAADGTLDLAVDNLDWSRGDREVGAPHARWHAILATAGDRRLVHGTLTVDALELDFGDHSIVLRDVRDDIDGSITGDLRAGVASLDHHLGIQKVTQDLVEHYRMGDLTLDIKAHRDADGVVHIGELALGNRVGGTTLSLHGGIDAGAERRSLSLQGKLEQDLSRPWAAPGEMQGSGRVAVQLRLDSGNLRVYHALAAVRISGATIKLPQAGVTIEKMDGEIPLTADLVSDAKGMHLLRSSNVNSYSELRFADQHPLLSRPSFVSIARIVTPLVTLAPLVGNLRVDDNIVSLNQLELGVRGGRVTGLAILDWREEGATAQLRVRASDVKSSHGEPFDGNAALIVSTRDRTVDGRAEIIRIGKRHLLDLLDLDDPHHADAAVNRVRRALSLGYPDHVRLTFKHGFADAKIEFGGLARLVRVDELRGIPMGPVIDKALAPLEKKQQEEEE
jgi:hypothetical protein